MNKWNQLLKCLDAVYGFENQVKSTFRKTTQGFDNKSNEHVIVIEYRVMRGDPSATRKKKKEKAEIRRADNVKIGKLLQDIQHQANLRVATGDGESDTQSPPVATLP
jgi:hypothetical protein